MWAPLPRISRGYSPAFLVLRRPSAPPGPRSRSSCDKDSERSRRSSSNVTERPTDPASGQVALPGGRVEDSDGSLRVTALRELEEEVGLTETDLAGPPRYVATENAFRFGLTVAVFAAELGSTARPPSVLSVDEVAHVFWLPRSALGSEKRVHRETDRGLLEVPATVFEGHVLWGFTRRLLREFYGLPKEDELGGPAFAPDPSRSRNGDADASVRGG